MNAELVQNSQSPIQPTANRQPAMVNGGRKTRSKLGERGYLAIREAAYQVRTLRETDLVRIGHAINPDVRDRMHLPGAGLVVLDDHWWQDEEVEPMLDQLTHCWGAYLPPMVEALVFFRERARARYAGTSIVHDIRLCFEFDRSHDDGRKIWLDCETGLPWMPRACLKLRGCVKLEERAKLEARDLEVFRKAEAVVAEIHAEKLKRADGNEAGKGGG